MSDPVAVIVMFNGDPADLLERLEKARESSIEEARGDEHKPPAFFAVCRAREGVVLISGWDDKEDHRAFFARMRPHLEAAGVGRPDEHEHLTIVRLGWDPVPAADRRRGTTPE